MAGSEAEERIRGKAEAFLRENYPDARIIHELMLEQGGCRIDLAAVTQDQIIVAEIKSERDVLHRLADQVRGAVLVSRNVFVCTSEKHAPKIEAMGDHWMAGDVHKANPDYIKELRWCRIYWESPPSGALTIYGRYYWHDSGRVLNAKDLLKMLWAAELRSVCFDMGVGQKATRNHCIALACETLSGREVRRRVCRELRSRPFPRADAAIEAPREKVTA
jgi:hypothetical protein